MPKPLRRRPAALERTATSPSLSDVARAAGVTVTAASALFKGRVYAAASEPTSGRRATVGVSPAARGRIIDAARALGFQPTDPAWRLRLYPERGDICFLLPAHVTDGLANPYFGRFANGAMARLHALDRHLAFAFFDPATDYVREHARLPAPVRQHQTSACLLAGNPNPSLIAALIERDLPVLTLSRIVEIPGVHGLAPDYAAALRLQFSRLHELGHQRIAVAAGAYLAGASYAWRILRPAIDAATVEFFPESAPPIVWADVVDGTGSYPLWEKLAELRPRPTAVAFLDDYSARMTMQAALRAGLRVPEDLGFIGMNNDLLSVYAPVPLTTVDFHGEQIGALAVDELAARTASNAPKATAPTRKICPVTLIERESLA